MLIYDLFTINAGRGIWWMKNGSSVTSGISPEDQKLEMQRLNGEFDDDSIQSIYSCMIAAYSLFIAVVLLLQLLVVVLVVRYYFQDEYFVVISISIHLTINQVYIHIKRQSFSYAIITEVPISNIRYQYIGLSDHSHDDFELKISYQYYFISSIN